MDHFKTTLSLKSLTELVSCQSISLGGVSRTCFVSARSKPQLDIRGRHLTSLHTHLPPQPPRTLQFDVRETSLKPSSNTPLPPTAHHFGSPDTQTLHSAKMVLLEDDWMCTLCSEHCESQQQLLFHLSAIHSVQSGHHASSPFAPMPQTIAAQTHFNNSYPNALSSPFVPTPGQPLVHAQQQQQPTTYPAYSYTPRQTAPAHLLTPPSSLGTASSSPNQRFTQAPRQTHPSPRSVAQQTPSYSPSQQNETHMMYGNMLPWQNKGYITPHQVSQQALQRQMSTRNPKSNAPTTAPKRKQPAPALKAGKLPPGLSPLPQAIYDLGLTDTDFDPDIEYEKFAIKSRYVDIPASVDIDDAHMFNANPNTILCYGNLLRLAGRFADWEITEKINAGRSNPRLFKNALVKKRLQAAVKWAAERPEWQGVGDVQTWLSERQRARQSEIDNRRCKRKREDDDVHEPITIDDHEAPGWYEASSALQRSQLVTPPPAKRMRPAITSDLATPPACHGDSNYVKDDVHDRKHAGGALDAASYSTPSMERPAGQYDTTFLTPESISSPAVPKGLATSSPTDTTNHHTSPSPAVAVASATASTYTPSDLADLSNAIGAEGAMALVNALGMGDEHSTTASEAPPAAEATFASESTSVIDLEPDQNNDAIFEEWLSHPENFMSPWELKVAEKWAIAVEVANKRRGSTW